LDVARTDAKHREEDAAGALLLDEPREIALVRHADVEVSIGCEDDAVDASLDELFLRDLVRERDSRRAVRRSARFEPRDCFMDAILVPAAGRRQHDTAR